MKLRDRFVITHGENGKTYAVATGDAARYFNGKLELNEMGLFIFEQLMSHTDESRIADAITKEYAVDRLTALSDIKKFIRQLRSADIIED